MSSISFVHNEHIKSLKLLGIGVGDLVSLLGKMAVFSPGVGDIIIPGNKENLGWDRRRKRKILIRCRLELGNWQVQQMAAEVWRNAVSTGKLFSWAMVGNWDYVQVELWPGGPLEAHLKKQPFYCEAAAWAIVSWFHVKWQKCVSEWQPQLLPPCVLEYSFTPGLWLTWWSLRTWIVQGSIAWFSTHTLPSALLHGCQAEEVFWWHEKGLRHWDTCAGSCWLQLLSHLSSLSFCNSACLGLSLQASWTIFASRPSLLHVALCN